ncbi:MAG: cryptochrome/photolyase family protein, partial [Gemmataceae bacterium]
MRNLVLVLGDQLDPASSAFDGFDPARDAVWMAEVAEESTHVWSHKARTALFFSAMRHFAADLRGRGVTVHYGRIGTTAATLAGQLAADVKALRPASLVVAEPGDWRVRESLKPAGVEVRPDRHFYSTPEQFAAFARGRKSLRLEHFYRPMRREHRVLMDGDGPCGGEWNYDADNRGRFGKAGPGLVPEPAAFEPDAITR